MPKHISEVATISGTNGNDSFNVNAAVAAALNSGDGEWDNQVQTLGGDDLVVRDRTGDYSIHDGAYSPVYIYGGTGTDTLSYMSLGTGVTADLWFGSVLQHLPDNAPAWQVPFAQDRVFGFERFAATAHDDDITGSDSVAERIWAHDGNDTVSGAGGNDTVYGGQGNDLIDGDAGNDSLLGEDGNDSLDGGAGNDTAYGGEGADAIDGDAGNDSLKGEDGNDSIDGGTGKDTIYGGDGDDSIDGGLQDDVIYAGDGHDDIHGGSGDDTIYLDDGSDTVNGGAGADVIHVDGFGDHEIEGGINWDKVVYGSGATVVNLNTGVATRADGTDAISGVEAVETGSGQDTITGSQSANMLKAGSGADWVNALGGNDTVYGDGGNDTVFGHNGNDRIYGDSGNDELDGGSGNDAIAGDGGADHIRGGLGADIMTGGSGPDVFTWNVGDVGYDRILDFDLSEDKLSFGAGFFATGPDGSVDLADVLTAADLGGGAAGLMANMSLGGWQPLAVLDYVSVVVLSQKIANGTILDIEVNGDGPGGLGGFHFDDGF